jgi:OOP family OmpA-OmpF porin
MQVRNALLAATVMALPLAAQAQPVSGLYVAGGIGANFLEGQTASSYNFPFRGPNASGSSDLNSRAGPVGVISAGWGFGNGLRVELEGNWMNNQINSANGTAAGNVSVNSATGKEQKFGGLANAYYDFTWLTPWVIPFIGAGVGYEGIYRQNFTLSGTDDGFPVNYAAHNSVKGAFAYQAMIGAALPIPSVPGLAVTVDYRFMGLAGNQTQQLVATAGAGVRPVAGTVKFTDDYNHAVMIGVRYAFGAPPPPPPAPIAAPAPAPARSYLVFFDWDKATLTPRAQQIIGEAAANSTKVAYTQIQVNGYTDTSGTPQYNQGLSIRRAQAVAAELVKDGVPKASIAIQGFGETHLLVPTGPGVREPQNRRVEIIIR